MRLHPEVLEAVMEEDGDEVLDEEAIGDLLQEFGQGYSDMNPDMGQGILFPLNN